ncbi:hypothetical protein FHT76_003375 [Rhizobium sp. BK176]|nr:hypothetical protein [Rhizobium sp. BK399]MCS3738596.1 hypothetical protein [Rhizobium sp. BK661]MCS4091716.1 hypothetical protein [Rhizobium sp. BK176]
MPPCYGKSYQTFEGWKPGRLMRRCHGKQLILLEKNGVAYATRTRDPIITNFRNYHFHHIPDTAWQQATEDTFRRIDRPGLGKRTLRERIVINRFLSITRSASTRQDNLVVESALYAFENGFNRSLLL